MQRRHSGRLFNVARSEIFLAEGQPPSGLRPEDAPGPFPALPLRLADRIADDEIWVFPITDHTVGFYQDYVDVDHAMMTFPTEKLVSYFGEQDVARSPPSTFVEAGWTALTSSLTQPVQS